MKHGRKLLSQWALLQQGEGVHQDRARDIYLLKMAENTKVKLHSISPQELSNAAALWSLALFLRYKLELGDGWRNDLGVQMSCEA